MIPASAPRRPQRKKISPGLYLLLIAETVEASKKSKKVVKGFQQDIRRFKFQP
jgi:hypothetical protein